jgi:MFS family permease
MMVSFTGLVGAILLIQSPPSSSFVWVAAGLFGFCMGAFGTLFTLLIQDNFGLRSFGSITGISHASGAATMAIGPLIGGIVFDTTGSYSLAFIIVAALMATGVLALTQALHRKGVVAE